MNFDTAAISGVLSNVPSANIAESTLAEETRAGHAALAIVSAGKDEGEEKNQDRLMLLEVNDNENTKCQFAIVCDGTTTSPYAAVAAEYVAGQVQTLFQEEGLEQTVEALKGMRLALLERPLKLEEGQSALLRSMFEEIVRQKFQRSYQTTFVAVCLKREDSNSAGMISIKAIGCGDSALFIFGSDGELHYNNANLTSGDDPFRHSSPLTAVLPDSYTKETNNVLFDFQEFPEDAQLLLCSDGFYDGFTNFNELRAWLIQHGSALADSESRDACLAELHNNLNQKKGDDDITFIWLHPGQPSADEQKTVAAQNEEVRPAAECSKSNKRGIFGRFLAALGRRFKFITRFLSPPSGAGL